MGEQEQHEIQADAKDDASASIELRPDHRGAFDEIVVRGVDTVHFEMMDDNRMWIGLYRSGELMQRVWISARGKLTVTTEEA